MKLIHIVILCLFFAAVVGNILLQPINGEAVRELTDFQSGDIYNFAFSTDGTGIYLARGYQVKKRC